ncbi:MAG TPA: hydrogenase/urease maturation nickel metallochaperone HypA, partial [Desulfohalobiaceae bacterium]|nr:hydrogenase/urease maturation nickel metallochaperone HypA [Desulfohalobiaceae bacterium]
MHEMSIAQNLLSLIREEMANNQVTRLYKVKIKAGEFNS